MKIRIKDLDRLIEILSKKRDELINEERDKQIDLSDVLRQQPYIPKESFPEKWYIKVTKENVSILNEFLKENKKYYKDYINDWKIRLDTKYNHYFHFPQAFDDIHSSYIIQDGYKELTVEQYEIIRDKYLPF